MGSTMALMLSLSLSSVVFDALERRSSTVCQSDARFVLARSRFFDGGAGCQLQSMAKDWKWSEL